LRIVFSHFSVAPAENRIVQIRFDDTAFEVVEIDARTVDLHFAAWRNLDAACAALRTQGELMCAGKTLEGGVTETEAEYSRGFLGVLSMPSQNTLITCRIHPFLKSG
jgi:hypothetical protein